MSLTDLIRVEGDAARALLAESAFPRHAKYYLTGAPVLVHEGDLIVEGDLFFPLALEGPHHLFVRGDLIVRGHYADADDPESSVLVTGSMRATIAVTNGRLEVGGDLDVLALIGDYNDHLCQIGGTLRAALFEPDEHFFEAVRAEIAVPLGNRHRLDLEEGDVTWADTVFDDDDDDAADTRYYHFLREIFAHELVMFEDHDDEDDLYFDIWLNNAQLHRRLRAGEPVLQPGFVARHSANRTL